MSGKTHNAHQQAPAWLSGARKQEFTLSLAVKGLGRIFVDKGDGPVIETQSSLKMMIPAGTTVKIEAKGLSGGGPFRGFQRVNRSGTHRTRWLKIVMRRDLDLIALFETEEKEVKPDPESEPQQDSTEEDKRRSDYATRLAERF